MEWTKAGQRQLQYVIARMVTIPLAVGAFAYALHWVYLNLITDTFKYLGYTYQQPTLYVTAFAFIAATIAAWLLPTHLRQPSDVMLWVVFIVAVIPSIFVPTYAGYQSDSGTILSSLGFAGAFMLAILIARRKIGDTVTPLIKPVSTTSFWLLIAVYSLAVYALLQLTIGLSLNFVSLANVYDQRDEYKTSIAGAPAIVTYLVSIQANVVNPLIIARGVISRKWMVVALGVLGQALLYSETGFKTILFSVPLVVLFMLILRGTRHPKAIWFLWGGVAVIILAAVADSIQGDIIWTSMFSRRFLITPGVLTAAYMEYYSNAPFAMLSHSILGGITGGSDAIAPAMAVGQWMSGNPLMSANANLLADGYANFGTLGIFGAAIVFGIYLRLLDRAAHGLPFAVTAAVVVMPAITLANTSILTAMLSHGLVAAFLLLIIAPRDGWERKPRPPKKSVGRNRFYAIEPSTGRVRAKKD